MKRLKKIGRIYIISAILTPLLTLFFYCPEILGDEVHGRRVAEDQISAGLTENPGAQVNLSDTAGAASGGAKEADEKFEKSMEREKRELAEFERKVEKIKKIKSENSEKGSGENALTHGVSGASEKKEGDKAEYTICEADVLYIHVWQEDSLCQEVIVRPDGKISFPLAGDIYAMGMTFPQLKDKITDRLKKYLKYPIVSITLKKMGGRKVIVLGEVGRPGVYSVARMNTVLEAIALAGGFTMHAVPSSTILIRGGLQSPEATRLNLTRAIDKGDYSQNVVLQAEDIIYIPKKFIANINYALTQIIGPISQGVYSSQTLHNW